MGLLGPSLTPADLASAARIYLPTGQVTLQPHWVDGNLAGESSSTRGTRFPQFGLAYPVAALSGTAILHIGSFMDQRWEVQEASVLEFRGSEVPVTDQFRSDGGISTVQLGWAQRLGEDLSLGIGVGSRIGSVTRTFRRTLDPEEVFDVIPFRTGNEWRYSGITGSFGFQWDPFEVLRIGGAVDWSQELKAEPVDESAGSTERFDLPTVFRLGASGVLTPRLAVSAGMTFAEWEPSGEGLDEEALAGSVVSYGGGMEWAGPTIWLRRFPVRVGFKRSELPFTFDGEQPTEAVWTAGIGLDLMPPQSGYIGTVDLGFERGDRDAGSLSESFWRASMTFRVGGF